MIGAGINKGTSAKYASRLNVLNRNLLSLGYQQGLDGLAGATEEEMRRAISEATATLSGDKRHRAEVQLLNVLMQYQQFISTNKVDRKSLDEQEIEQWWQAHANAGSDASAIERYVDCLYAISERLDLGLFRNGLDSLVRGERETIASVVRETAKDFVAGTPHAPSESELADAIESYRTFAMTGKVNKIAPARAPEDEAAVASRITDRMALHWTPHDLAERSGLPTSVCIKVLTGQHDDFLLSTLTGLAFAEGIDIRTLVEPDQADVPRHAPGNLNTSDRSVEQDLATYRQRIKDNLRLYAQAVSAQSDEISAKTGINIWKIKDIARGQADPTLQELQRIAKIGLGIPVWRLFAPLEAT